MICWFNEPNQLTKAPNEHQHWWNKRARNTGRKENGIVLCFEAAGEKATDAYWQLQ